MPKCFGRHRACHGEEREAARAADDTLLVSVQGGDGVWLAGSAGTGCPCRRRAAVHCCPFWCKQGILSVNLDVEVLPY